MQIHSVILFSHDGRRRELKFHLNGVSIIAGDSATGKSALVEIIDYCFGSGECRVPDGVIRERVAWYALKMVSDENGQLFIARRGPENGGKSTHRFVLLFGKDVVIPELQPGDFTHNLEDAVRALSEYLGIRANETQIAADGAVNYDITARHAIKFCLQYQDEIASKRTLFHQQGEGFKAKSIYESLPYLLGLQAEDFLGRIASLRIAKKELAEAKRRLSEYQSLASAGLDGGVSLVSEAGQVGLLKLGTLPSTPERLLQVLDTLVTWSPEAPSVSNASDDTLVAAQQELAMLDRERQNLKAQIVAAESATELVLASAKEWQEQAARLQSSQLFPRSGAVETHCPLCEQTVGSETLQLPRFRAVQDQFALTHSQLDDLAANLPNINSYLETLREDLQRTDSSIVSVRQSIKRMQNERADRSALLDLAVRQALVVGRIEQYLTGMRGSLGQGTPLRRAVEVAQNLVDELEAGISDADIAGQLRGVADRLQDPMTRWATELKLEFAPDPFRINFQELTVEVSRNGALPLYRMGSGKNWLGCHLIAHFALHEYFLKHRRPVPSFLFLDQPTQVFYPPEEVDRASGETANLTLREANASEDRDIVQRIFGWINKLTSEFNKMRGFQVIVTDHAELNTDQFRKAKIDPPRWRTDGNSLIPLDWIEG